MQGLNPTEQLLAALKPHTLCVRRKHVLACRHLLPMGLGLACPLPPEIGWLSCPNALNIYGLPPLPPTSSIRRSSLGNRTSLAL